MGTNIRDLARMANTSVATVSRALNGKPGISEIRRNNILQLAKQMNFRPNRLAQNLSNRKSRMIGFIGSTLDNPIYLHYFSIIEDSFKTKGYQLLIADSKLSMGKEIENIEMMLEHRAEGLIILPVADWEKNDQVDHYLRLKLAKVPFVVMGNIEGYSFDCVYAEEVEAARAATRYLIDKGHRRIAYIGHTIGNRASTERLEGMALALTEAGLIKERDTLSQRTMPEVDLAPETIEENLKRLLTGPKAPTALLGASDSACLLLYRPFKNLGIRIPDDVSIVTFGDSAFSQYLIPALTLCATDDDLVAHEAVRVLELRMNDPGAPPVIRKVSQRFIERESVAPPASEKVPCGARS